MKFRHFSLSKVSVTAGGQNIELIMHEKFDSNSIACHKPVRGASIPCQQNAVGKTLQ